MPMVVVAALTAAVVVVHMAAAVAVKGVAVA